MPSELLIVRNVLTGPPDSRPDYHSQDNKRPPASPAGVLPRCGGWQNVRMPDRVGRHAGHAGRTQLLQRPYRR
jgi:hypothetical protein